MSEVDWIENFAPVWTYLQINEPDGPVFLVIYAGGEKVDFHFFKVSDLEKLVSTQKLPSSYLRGYRVVVDKDGLAINLPPSLKIPPTIPKPSEEEFQLQVRAFWFSALYVAKQIHRRNLWVVKFRDWGMKENLLKVMEWRAQSIHEWEIETWIGGHYIEEWVDEQTKNELQQVFGRFGAEDSWRALFATMNLFRRLARDLSDDLGYNYLIELDQNVSNRVREIRKSDSC